MRAIIAVSLAVLPMLAAAQVYRWTDATGKVHYSDRPPAEAKGGAQAISRGPGQPSDAAGTPKRPSDQRGEAGKKAPATKEAAERAAKEQEDKEKKERNCASSRAYLEGLEGGVIRFGTNERGERVAMDGEAREAALAKARQNVAEWCK